MLTVYTSDPIARESGLRLVIVRARAFWSTLSRSEKSSMAMASGHASCDAFHGFQDGLRVQSPRTVCAYSPPRRVTMFFYGMLLAQVAGA